MEYQNRVEPFTSKFAEEMLNPLLDTDNTDGNKQRRHKLLDVGCGTGAVSLIAVSKGLEVAVTDASEAMVERTKQRVEAATRGRDEPGLLHGCAVAQGQDLPSEWSDSFDLAVANFSVIFFPQPVAGLREMLRCLVPGTGIASLTAWGDASETPAFRVFPDVASRVVPELVDTGKPKRITGSVEALEGLMEEAGFVDVRVVGPVAKTLEVESPSDYYDRFALTSPPTAAMIARMGDAKRLAFREGVAEVARARGGRGDGSIALDSAAYIAYGRKPAPATLPANERTPS